MAGWGFAGSGFTRCCGQGSFHGRVLGLFYEAGGAARTLCSLSLREEDGLGLKCFGEQVGK